MKVIERCLKKKAHRVHLILILLGLTPMHVSAASDAPQGLISVAQPIRDIVGPLSLASGSIAILSVIVAVSSLMGSVRPSSLFLAFRQKLLRLLGVLPERKKVWGTVYDSQTKRPISFAQVRLLDENKRLLETRIADRDGRYGFLTTPESLHEQNIRVFLEVSAPRYRFPSHQGATIDAFVYRNLYYGGRIAVGKNTFINFDIPMDSMNSLHISSENNQKPSIAAGVFVAALADGALWIGLFMVPLNFLLLPNPFTFGTLCLFLGAASLRIWGIVQRPFGITIDEKTGRPLPFSLLTLDDSRGRRVAFTVSDESGRWFMTAKKGSYELHAVTPATIQPTRETRKEITVKKGWITQEVRL